MSVVELSQFKPLEAAVSFGSPALESLIASIQDFVERHPGGLTSTAQAKEAIALLKQAKFGAFRLPRAQGGGGASLRQLFEVTLRLGEIEPNVPHILRNHFAFVERALRVPDNPKYRKWLSDVRDGKIFGLGSSELGIQNIGSGEIDTQLTPKGDTFLLNGKKYYSTGNYYADLLYVWAKGTDGVRVAVVVPVDREGVAVDDDWDGFGQELTASGTTVFSNVTVHRDEVVVIADDEQKLPYENTVQQLYLTTVVAGILRRIVRDASNLLKRRDRNYYHAVAERPAEDPLLQQTIGRLASIAFVAEASVLHAADALALAFDSARTGTPDPELFLEASLRAAKSKVIIDELALDAATRLFDVGGASITNKRQRFDRHWRNIRTISSHNPLSYKARAIGQYEIDGTPLPNAAFF